MNDRDLYKLLGRGVKFRSTTDDSYGELISSLDMRGVTDVSYMKVTINLV